MRVESETCAACFEASTSDAFFTCLDNLPIFTTDDGCDSNEDFACCFNEASGLDCINDPTTFALIECLYDDANHCEENWTCSGLSRGGAPSTTSASGSTPTPSLPATTSATGGGAETAAPAAPADSTTSAGVDDTMAPFATDGGMYN
ncbi:unnamed protein product [Ectocarpus sp. CCAP 1310/34]|nr:unnamed protein product [Ectocarpus sp. CCAP 1310/34]